MVTTGVELTTTVIEVEALLPPLSVTEAVMRWVPEVRFVRVSDGPVPRLPSRLDPHWMARLESSKSLALAVNVMAWPCSKVVLLAGAVIVIAGVEFTTTVIDALPVLPPLSVTAAVMVCVPERSVLTGRDVPVPSRPSRLDVHRMVRALSSKSLAVAVEGAVWQCSALELLAGAAVPY